MAASARALRPAGRLAETECARLVHARSQAEPKGRHSLAAQPVLSFRKFNSRKITIAFDVSWRRDSDALSLPAHSQQPASRTHTQTRPGNTQPACALAATLARRRLAQGARLGARVLPAPSGKLAPLGQRNESQPASQRRRHSQLAGPASNRSQAATHKGPTREPSTQSVTFVADFVPSVCRFFNLNSNFSLPVSRFQFAISNFHSGAGCLCSAGRTLAAAVLYWRAGARPELRCRQTESLRCFAEDSPALRARSARTASTERARPICP